MIRSRVVSILLLALLVAPLGGCDLVGDILEFGFWTLAIIVVLIIALLVWISRRMRRPRGGPPPAV